MLEHISCASAYLALRDDDTTLAPPATNGAQELLDLLQNPFAGQLQIGSIWASLGSSIGITVGIALAFSLLRPYNTVVYAPKLKHADELRAPPPLGKGLFAWVKPLWTTSEKDLVRLVGMDATLFMRFSIMCRNMFLILAVLGCAILIPVNMSKSNPTNANVVWLSLLTPANVSGDPLWAQVVMAWLTNIIVCGFLWWNYRKVLQLRRDYFESSEYQNSLHARTLMIYDIPKTYASDEGISHIIDEVVPNSSFARTAVARNVKILPELIAEHDKTVRKLEKVLAIYLENPQNLPAGRPMCAPSKKDRSYATYARGQKVDAIEYLTQRIKELETEIKEVRLSVDRRGTMSYGFASYADIAETHAIAYTMKRKKPQGATIALAPRPHDIIWDNMPLSAPTRARRRLWNNLWVALLTLIWVAPNAMIAIFLVNLSNLGLVWPGFQASLEASTTFWQIVQGILSPAVTSIVFLVLPIIFRRLAIRAGDQTKTGRERHVTGKLYTFFVFNNLFVFSLFSAIWTFTAGVVKQTTSGTDAWQAILRENLGQTFLLAMCNISPFWITWLLQRQLGAAVDLSQLWPLAYSFVMRRFSSPTPREMIELTAPPPFDYASYYNYFLFYSTVALCYACIQPLVLPAAALYFSIDVMLKKYLILYVFVTKTESGGMFWRVLYNRLVFGTILANLVVLLIVWVRGDSDHLQAYAVAPLPFIMVAFKLYCARVFDDKIHFYTTRDVRGRNPESGMIKEQSLRNDRLASRFGHPALYKPLITPMVHAKAQNILASVYQGRLTAGREAGSGDAGSVSGYSDAYVLDSMSSGFPGKTAGPPASMPGFEVVPQSRLDFEYYKNRDEFAADHGQGELFGKSSDIYRPDTPGGASVPGESRPGSPGAGAGGAFRAYSPKIPDIGGPYGAPSAGPYTSYGGAAERSRTSKMYSAGANANDSGSNLVSNAAPVPIAATPMERVGPAGTGMPGPSSRDRSQSRDRLGGRGNSRQGSMSARAPGMLGGGPQGYGGLPQTDEAEEDPMQYDYFRGARRNTGGGGNWGGSS